jgi:uncharacterized RDD family membrane protein YckC
MRRNEKRAGFADAAGRAALYPARVAARAWRGRLESAADDVIAAPETARVVDQALAGPLPEKLAQSLARHHVLERIAAELAASGELEKLVKQALESPHTRKALDQVISSDEMQRALRDIASSPEVRHAIARQTAGLAEEVVVGVRHAATRMDGRVGRPPASAAYAGVGSRAVALTIDAFLALLIYVSASAVVALIGSLVGGIRPHWLIGTLLGIGGVLVAFVYFVLFWSSAGQTPGMRLMRLRVRRPDGGSISALRAIVRVVGLGLAIIPFFAGFIPVLFDGRRRGLPDYLAGTVVVYDHPPDPA